METGSYREVFPLVLGIIYTEFRLGTKPSLYLSDCDSAQEVRSLEFGREGESSDTRQSEVSEISSASCGSYKQVWIGSLCRAQRRKSE